MDILQKIENWQKEYQPNLDALKEDQKKLGKAFIGKKATTDDKKRND